MYHFATPELTQKRKEISTQGRKGAKVQGE
jgi:hypothetical protein